LIPTPPEQCISQLGRQLGLEPVLVHSVWLPTKDEIPGRPVEGFYLMRDVPSCISLPPAAFHKEHPEKVLAGFDKVRTAISTSRLFAFTGHHKSKREWWENFFEYFPTDVNHLDYKDHLSRLGINFVEPCAKFIYDGDYKSKPEERCKWILPECGSGMEPILPGFSLPEVLAVSGNCVTSDFNMHPVHPRLYSMRDASLQVIFLIYILS